jgi:hypothetical protein
MVNELADEKTEQIKKLRKSEIIEFANKLLKEYYLELDDETIKQIYYKG